VKVAPLVLSQQLELDLKIVDSMKQSYTAVQQIRDLRVHLKELQTKLKDDTGAKAVLDAVNALDQKAANLIAVDLQYPPVGIVSVASMNGALSSLLQLVEGSDSPPTAQAADAFATYRRLLNQQLARWTEVKEKDLPALNRMLKTSRLIEIGVRVTREERALGQVNRPLKTIEENGVKFKYAELDRYLQAGDCRMESGSRLTFRNNGTGFFSSRVRTDAHNFGDTWHQRFSVNDAGGQELFRIPTQDTFLGMPSWWNRDVTNWVENGDVWLGHNWKMEFNFSMEYWDKMTFVTWIGDC